MGATILTGDRIAKQGSLMLGCTAAIFDPTRQKLLITQRSDNGRWCLPGGRMESGESVAEACEREVVEETGLIVRIVKLIGIYSDPNILLKYEEGDQHHLVALHFEAEIVGGTLGLSDETIAVNYFTPEQIDALDLMPHHRHRIADTFAGTTANIR